MRNGAQCWYATLLEECRGMHAVFYSYYDLDHDGRLSPSEIAHAMRVACGQDLSNSQLEKVSNRAKAVFEH